MLEDMKKGPRKANIKVSVKTSLHFTSEAPTESCNTIKGDL